MPITKSEIQFIKSLNLKKNRETSGFFIVEGEKMVKEALISDFEVKSVFYSDEIGIDQMKKITQLSSPSPALAVIHKPVNPNSSIETSGLSLALDSIRDPGNLGTIIRIADWFGINKIYASEDTVDLYNPKTIQSSMGAIFRKQVTYIDLKKVISTYSNSKVDVYATSLDGESIQNCSFSCDNALIIMGSENNGISAQLLSLVKNRILIPPFPTDSKTSESLNVAIATAIMCYEFRKGSSPLKPIL